MIQKVAISICILLVFLLFPIPKSYSHDVSQASESAQIEYFLPYPGLLPGSPIYPLKAIRDRITEFLISDPGKKAEFYILQADKRLNAAVLLQEKGEGDLSESTLSKAEKYLDKALSETEEFKNSGQNVFWILGNIERSLRKHHAVLHNLINKTKDKKLSHKYSQSLELNEKLLERVIKLRSTE